MNQRHQLLLRFSIFSLIIGWHVFVLIAFQQKDDERRMLLISTLSQKNEANVHVGKPRRLKLSPKKVLLLHIGKAAGGTFNHRVRAQWNLFIEQCHPRPCNKVLRKPDNRRDIFITLRDPIDRFLSAFYWRAYMVCHPDETQRKWDGPPRGCKAKRYPEEARILYHTYNLSASQLAEDLCSTSDAVRTKAQASLSRIEHARWSVENWLDFDWKQHSNSTYPLVVENGCGSFEDQVDTAIRWLYNRTQFESLESFQKRYSFLKKQDDHDNVNHSSVGLKRDLSDAAELCLAQFYCRDYEIIRDLGQFACKSEACRKGTNSILSRRAALLQQSLG